MAYYCVEICKHIGHGTEKEDRCGSAHRTVKAALRHAPSAHGAYFSSNQPYDQDRIEVRDDLGEVHATLRHKICGRGGIYARWVREVNPDDCYRGCPKCDGSKLCPCKGCHKPPAG